MLESLTISNVGIISEASIELDPGLTVLTGGDGCRQVHDSAKHWAADGQ